MRHEMAILGLWLAAAVATYVLTDGSFTYLGPLFFICMVGSIFIVRSAKKQK